MKDLIDAAMPQLVVVPILLPLAAAAFMLLFDESHRQLKAVVNVVATSAGLLVAMAGVRRFRQAA